MGSHDEPLEVLTGVSVCGLLLPTVAFPLLTSSPFGLVCDLSPFPPVVVESGVVVSVPPVEVPVLGEVVGFVELPVPPSLAPFEPPPIPPP